jgi:ATP-dependent exoDNAse (exonuclease V) alpha subunit
MEESFSSIIFSDPNVEFNVNQKSAIININDFIYSSGQNICVLKGFAGTGKTYIVSRVVKNLWKIKKPVILLAPTGRSAKVLSSYCNKEAHTVHKEIFYVKNNPAGNIDFSLKINKHKNTIFIVDEASMIPTVKKNETGLFSDSLLDNIVKYVYSGYKCSLLIIGDLAQLPPIFSENSLSLDHNFLKENYDLKVFSSELTQVVRQKENSGILSLATYLRNLLEMDFVEKLKINLSSYNDITLVEDGDELINSLQDSYDKFGLQETAVIVRSNKRSNIYNKNIREKILCNDSVISVGDLLMVVKNNYHWLNNNLVGFIANGDIIKIEEIHSLKDLYGFRFAEVRVTMIDYPNLNAFETVLILDSIEINSPSLDYNVMNKLYSEVSKDYIEIKTKYKRHLAIKKNKFFNALQVKFAYCFTCHKSQGGQWRSIFVEMPFLPSGYNKDFLRWFYTAVTRAKNKLHLIGFKNEYFK